MDSTRSNPSEPMLVRTSLATPPTKERYYIDVTTNGINTNTGVSGTPQSFSAKIDPLVLNPDKQYTVEVVSWIYGNTDLSPLIVYPILLSDVCKNIRVINTNSSLLYKSSQLANNTDIQNRNQSNNSILKLPVAQNTITEINFELVRSDDGLPFTPSTPFTSILLLIESE
jgi:hypothetical protein